MITMISYTFMMLAWSSQQEACNVSFDDAWLKHSQHHSRCRQRAGLAQCHSSTLFHLRSGIFSWSCGFNFKLRHGSSWCSQVTLPEDTAVTPALICQSAPVTCEVLQSLMIIKYCVSLFCCIQAEEDTLPFKLIPSRLMPAFCWVFCNVNAI